MELDIWLTCRDVLTTTGSERTGYLWRRRAPPRGERLIDKTLILQIVKIHASHGNTKTTKRNVTSMPFAQYPHAAAAATVNICVSPMKYKIYPSTFKQYSINDSQ